MREGIHPNYYQAKVVCNCGNEFVTGSTKEGCDVVPSPNFGYTRCEMTHILQQECEAFLKGGAL